MRVCMRVLSTLMPRQNELHACMRSELMKADWILLYLNINSHQNLVASIHHSCQLRLFTIHLMFFISIQCWSSGETMDNKQMNQLLRLGFIGSGNYVCPNMDSCCCHNCGTNIPHPGRNYNCSRHNNGFNHYTGNIWNTLTVQHNSDCRDVLDVQSFCKDCCESTMLSVQSETVFKLPSEVQSETVFKRMYF